MPETSDPNDPTARVTPSGRLLPPTAEIPQLGSGYRENTSEWSATPPEERLYAPETDSPERERPERDPVDAPRRRGRGAGCLFWLAGLIALILVVGIGAKVTGLLPDIHNPFQKKTEDTSQPTLLLSIQDLSRFEAATGNFQEIIEQKDTIQYIPDFIYSHKVLFVAAGSVDAYVDFTHIADKDIQIDQAAKTVTLHLPEPQLESVNLDLDKSKVWDESEGAYNSLKGVFSDDPNKLQKFYQLGEARIAAAAQDSDLRSRAAANTTKMLEQLLKSLGYTAKIVFPNP